MAVSHHKIILLESPQRFLDIEILFLCFFVFNTWLCSTTLILFNLSLE